MDAYADSHVAMIFGTIGLNRSRSGMPAWALVALLSHVEGTHSLECCASY